MSNGPENVDLMASKAAGLTEHVGPYYGDIFLASRRLFPTLTLIEHTEIQVMSDSDLLVGGINTEGKPVIHLGLKGALTQRVRERLVRRLGLPVKPHELYDYIFRRIVFGHETGHVVQGDPNFEAVFGPMDHTVYQPEDDYQRYLNSDKEVNADYIAAKLIGNSELGEVLGFEEPSQSPDKWREWAQEHP